MATLPAIQQPDLRPFIVYDRLPAHCMAFHVTNNDTAPLLRQGDIAIVQTDDREPAEGELFLIQFMRGGPVIVDMVLKAGRYGSGPGGAMIDTHAWWVGVYNRPRSHEEVMSGRHGWGTASRPIPTMDGPYATEGEHAGYLQSKLIGRVIGILEPRFEEPKRIGKAVQQ